MNFSPEQGSLLAYEHYGITATARPLNGYDEQNFLLTAQDGNKYTFKIAGSDISRTFLEAQADVMHHLDHSSIQGGFPVCLENKQGKAITTITYEGKEYHIRILTYLEGHFWVDEKNKNNFLYESLGEFLGAMDRSLEGICPDATVRNYVWDNNRAPEAEKKLHFIRDHEKRRIAAYFLLQFRTEVTPVLSELRHACIHGDANDYNLLVRNGRVSGLIDFGDMIYSATINNLAIACAYALLHTEDPIEKASLIVKGYHSQYPLTEQEIDILYYLIAGRLCISVTQSAEKSYSNSENEHHFLSEQPAWRLLYQLIRTNPLYAADQFRRSCGMMPCLNPEDDYSSLLSERNRYIGRNLSISYRTPLKIVKGALQYLYDDKGKTYLDCVNNVSHVGHCHPGVVYAIQSQVAKLNTNTRYLHDNITSYAKALVDTLPERLSVCYFVNSGSEANDLAIRMARHFTGHNDIVVLDHAYHGTSTLAMEISPYKFDGIGGFGARHYIHKAASPNLYRGPYGIDDEAAGEKYAQSVKEIVQGLEREDKSPAAFICETLLGVGGQIPLPTGYLKQVYQYIRSAGGVCIADEVQVGFGRIGEAFWGFELQEVTPDIVVLGKPIGNGHPLAAVVVTQAIADAFNNGMEYFNTFGGNPVSMAAGMAVLNIIRQEELQQHALNTGNGLMDDLRKLMEKHTIIGDVRGHGLFVGVELVRNRVSKEPAVPEIDVIVERMKGRGFLLSTDGPLHNVLKIKPPMVISRQNCVDLVQALDEVLSEEL